MSYILIYSFSYVAGVVGVSYLTQLPSITWLITVLVYSLLALLLSARSSTINFSNVTNTDFSVTSCLSVLFSIPWLQKLKLLLQKKSLLALNIFLMSSSLAALHGHYLLSQQFDDSVTARHCLLNGVVSGIPKLSAKSSRFVLLVDQATCGEQAVALNKVSLSYYYPKMMVNAGDQLTLDAKLKTPRSNYSYDTFDAGLWAINNGINATGYVRQVISLKAGFSKIQGLRHQLKRWIDKQEISNNAKATLLALILGDKSSISDDQWQQMRSTGTVHLLVVSGLHVGIMVAIGWWILFVIRSVLQTVLTKNSLVSSLTYLPEIGALLISLSYVFLAGASLSTQRAWLMALVLIAGNWLTLKPSLWQRWWIALIVIITWQPLSVMQPGFWLSFAAVASLICLQGYRTNQGKWLVLAKSQIWVWLALLPLLLLFFQQLSLISPLVNIVAISFISLLLLLLIPVLLLGAFDIVLPIQLIAQALDYFWLTLGAIETSASSFIINIDTLPWPLVLLIALSCITLVLPIAKRLKAVASMAVLLIAFPPNPVSINQPQFKITLIDVGQGLAVLVQTNTHNLLFDTGAAFESGFNYFDANIKPLLSRLAIHSLDLLVISHTDNDHSGGLVAAQKALKIKKLDSELAGTSVVFNQVCQTNKSWLWDKVSFHYRHSKPLENAKANNKSCVLEIANSQCKVLIMGDAEKKVEALLIPSQKQSKQNVLVVGHHGSNTSTTTEFLQQERFTAALISNGYNNRYGHPHPLVLKRLKDLKVKVYRTDSLGSIELQSVDGGCHIKSYKKNHKRYWW